MTTDQVEQAMRAIPGAKVEPLHAGGDALLIRIERGHTRARMIYRAGRTTALPLSLEMATVETRQNRRTGVMRGIVEDVLEVADRLGLAASLEAGSPTDEIPVDTLVSIYRKFGFEDTGERSLTGAAKMTRAPGATIQPPTAAPRGGVFARLIAWLRVRGV